MKGSLFFIEAWNGFGYETAIEESWLPVSSKGKIFGLTVMMNC